MKIITVPHPTLRQSAAPIMKVDKKTVSLISDLAKTLKNKRNPRGVGLAAPQVDNLIRAFAIDQSGKEHEQDIKVFLNPVITKHSFNKSLGEDPKAPTLEGCLSIPKLYGPVPRWEWVEVEFDEIVEGELQRQKARFDWYIARVFQHELDHLDGVLFTDYSLEYDLPLYQENEEGKLEEMLDRQIIKVF